MANLKGCYLSTRADWRTPKRLFENLQKEFGVLYDPCPANPLINGLELDWESPAYVNPPYNQIMKWVIKAISQMQKGVKVIMLLPVRTDTKWFHNYILPHHKEIRFIKGRLRFDDYKKGSAPFPSMIVIL